MAEGQSSTVSSSVEYRDIPGFSGYRVGSDGSVWSCRVATPVKGGRRGEVVMGFGDQWRRLKSYPRFVRGKVAQLSIVLRKANGRQGNFAVHRLVTLAFLGPRPEGYQVCHNDGNAANNAISNLRYDTPKGNIADKRRHGTHIRGEQMAAAKLTEDGVRAIRNRLARGEKLRAIAQDYGVNFTLISLIKRGKAWWWLDQDPTGGRVETDADALAAARMVVEDAGEGR